MSYALTLKELYIIYSYDTPNGGDRRKEIGQEA